MARDEHYERARKIAHSLPVVDFGSHEAIEAVAAVFRADAAERDALRVVAEAADPFARVARIIDLAPGPRLPDDAEPRDFQPKAWPVLRCYRELTKAIDALAALDRVREVGG